MFWTTARALVGDELKREADFQKGEGVLPPHESLTSINTPEDLAYFYMLHW